MTFKTLLMVFLLIAITITLIFISNSLSPNVLVTISLFSIAGLVYYNQTEISKVKQTLTNQTQLVALRNTKYAAIYYYRSLASIENGKFTPDAIEQAEAKMIDSEVDSYFLPEEYRQLWYDYWQKVAFISSLMRDKKVKLSDTKKKWKSEWKQQVVPFLSEVLEWEKENSGI